MSTAVNLVVKPRLLPRFHIKCESYISELLKWQKDEFKSIIEKYRILSPKCQVLEENFPIWTCWWQGKDNMPEVIRNCHESLLLNSNNHPIFLITKDNFSEYIDIPGWLIDKQKSGSISLSHFSDMIRLLLLKKYGGVWIDSALFHTRPYEYGREFYMPKMERPDESICQGKWWFGVIQAPKNHFLVCFILDCLLHYWQKYDAAIDYLMFDGILRIGYEEFPEIKQLIDKLSVSNPDLHSSRYTFANTVDAEHLDYLIDRNSFLSLTWRLKYPLTDSQGNNTYYGSLLERFNLR